ncbi:hypothetical protein N494_11210 [Clostridium botulinum A2B7 92]|uniref:hypothetical protein n=1 Tax=Clostridium botulinum TaxID=1491 RepID=UPI0007E0BEE0|nr:hypothetical protein [Clostridium botulinum]KEJ01500.1 hypothetical protein N494_11210 [Clostridium botulinum A2B7 92]
MKPTLFNKEGHLTDDTVKLLKLGTLKDEELISILEHISDCQKCASVFADSFEDNELAEAPLGFEEKVQIEIKNKKKSNIRFSLYCARVAVAASIALIMVFSNGLSFIANTKTNYVKPLDLSFINSFNSELNTFSEKIIKMGVFNNDKEKK